MTSKQSDSGADDSYWSSLFELEETLVDESEPIEPPPVEAASPPAPPPFSRIPSKDPWTRARELQAADTILKLRVIGHNKGGLLVMWNEIQGFVPASQLIDFPQFHKPRERMQALAAWHDRVLRVKITEVNREKNRLVFSERASLVDAGEKQDLWHSVKAGDTVEGRITNLAKFGAFADLGGVEGLIHISEISWSRVNHPSDVLKVDQILKLLVLKVDHGAKRIGLSKKRLHPDPWKTAEERYKVDQLVTGKVGRIETYGVFVVLENELEGLVHVSELAEGVFLHPRVVVETGQELTARVLLVDAPNNRIRLSLTKVNKPADSG